MANKNYRSTVYKRAIDVGKITTPLPDDLVKIWRDAEGDEKAISLSDLAVGVVGTITIGSPANGLSLVGQELSLGIGAGLSVDDDNKIQLGDNDTIYFTPSTGGGDNGLLRFDGAIEMYLANGLYNNEEYIYESGSTYTKSSTFYLDDGSKEVNFFRKVNSGEAEFTLYSRTETPYLTSYIFGETTNANSSLSLFVENLLTTVGIFIQSTGSKSIEIRDTTKNKGAEYPSDYSANWTDHSLITKKWVTDNFGAIGIAHNPVTISGTPNGLSISGTQVLSLSLSSAGVTGALSGTDWGTFNGKQATLVSGTNIKTINGSSILGAGDLVVSGSKWTDVGVGNIYRNSSVSIGHTGDPTNTLDVNGTTRIRTISNGDGFVLTKSATGVVTSSSLIQESAGVVNIGNTALDYISWDDVSNTFGIFSQTQFLHKYRGGAAGGLNMGQYNISGNASINNTSNASLGFDTNNTNRILIEADGDVLLKKVDNGAGNFVTIDATTGQLRKRTAQIASDDLGGRSYVFTEVGTTSAVPTVTAGGTFSFGYDLGSALFSSVVGETIVWEASGRVQTRSFVGGITNIQITPSGGTEIFTVSALNLGDSLRFWKVKVMESPRPTDGIWSTHIELNIYDNTNKVIAAYIGGGLNEAGYTGYGTRTTKIAFTFSEANAANALELYSGYIKKYKPV